MENTKKTGTTTVGLKYKDGVILATDQKSTMGYMVSEKDVRKLYRITDRIGITTAGSVGDIQAIVRLLRAELKIYELQRGSQVTVKAASTLLSNILQGNKMVPYMGQFIIAGHDEDGGHIFTLDPLGGLEPSSKFTSTGSGSPFAYGALEDSYQEDADLQTALKTALRAVRSAKERDIASGGKGFNVAVMDSDGYRELSESEIEKYISQ